MPHASLTPAHMAVDAAPPDEANWGSQLVAQAGAASSRRASVSVLPNMVFFPVKSLTAVRCRCGRRLVKEIEALKQAHPNLQRISFIGEASWSIPDIVSVS